MTRAAWRTVDSELRQAIHDVLARVFDRITEETGGLIVVEDLKVNTYAVDVSVTMKPREEDPGHGE